MDVGAITEKSRSGYDDIQQKMICFKTREIDQTLELPYRLTKNVLHK